MWPAGCRGARWRCPRRLPRGCWIRNVTAARHAAFELLRAVRAGATFQAARDAALGRHAARDRRLAYELAAGVLRQQARLDRLLALASVDPRLHDVLRLGAYQLCVLTRVPPYAAVSTSVELARQAAGEGAAGYVNRVLRALARTAAAERRAPGATHPRWLLHRWQRQFGAAETARLVAWNDARPVLTLQPARWEDAVLRARLQAGGCGVGEAPLGAGLQVVVPPSARGLRPTALPGFATGGFIVQDPAQALACRYAAIPPGALVYDACAAPGGKAVLLERLGARVIAGDARRDRLSRLAETARRAGVAIRVALADLLTAPFGSAALDAVVVDVPCSATGTMARHPDARWRVSARLIGRLAARQRALITAAAPLVKRGGVLVYATCSLEPEENSDIVNEFLARHAEFTRAPVAGAVSPAVLTPDGDFQTLPQRHGMDGAYAARLVRVR
ncbi:MAG TPA: transcription antitermination factor NusB [Gemmatimonadales bacterium]|nr:transcription antitermination factor NusB [Gemmatimonadales bacterium]